VIDPSAGSTAAQWTSGWPFHTPRHASFSDPAAPTSSLGEPPTAVRH
jgi:hypothetical protein